MSDVSGASDCKYALGEAMLENTNDVVMLLDVELFPFFDVSTANTQSSSRHYGCKNHKSSLLSTRTL